MATYGVLIWTEQGTGDYGGTSKRIATGYTKPGAIHAAQAAVKSGRTPCASVYRETQRAAGSFLVTIGRRPDACKDA